MSLAQSPSERPALVVLIAVDQLRGDYLDRFGAQLTGGLARFHRDAAFFPHAWQDHSNTETAPGHATMLSGREPVHTEIISNNRGVPDATSPLVAANGAGASPRRFNGTTLYD
jgi:predicted AlkP superfamily pyrophosphatase or phosphodiesterase